MSPFQLAMQDPRPDQPVSDLQIVAAVDRWFIETFHGRPDYNVNELNRLQAAKKTLKDALQRIAQGAAQ